MAVGSRPFAYNTGAPIAGTDQVGNLAVGTPTAGFESTGLEWWNGPGEGSGWIIAKPVPLDNQDTPVPGDDILLDPALKGGDITLINNQTAHQVFSYQQSALGQTIISGSDKVMFSVKFTSTNPSVGTGTRFIGVGKTTMNYNGTPFGGYPGNDNQSIGFSDDGQYYSNGSGTTNYPTWTSGDIIDIAIAHGEFRWWIRVNGGNWNNSATASPSLNSGGAITSGIVDFRPALCPSIYGTMEILNVPKYGYPTGFNFLGHTTASVGFLRSTDTSDASFATLVNKKFNQSFALDAGGVTLAKAWLTTNGYWTNR